MSKYEKKKRPALYLYHEDLYLMEALPGTDIAIMLCGLSKLSRALANGEDVDSTPPDGLSEMASRIYTTMAEKVKYAQIAYDERAQTNSDNRQKALNADDGRRPSTVVDDGRPSKSKSKTKTKTKSSSSSSSYDGRRSSTTVDDGRRSSTMVDDGRRWSTTIPIKDSQQQETTDDDDDDKEFLTLCSQLADSGIADYGTCRAQLSAWRNEYGFETLSAAVKKSLLHNPQSLAYIGASLANKDKPKPTKDNSYSQRDYSSDTGFTLPEWQIEAMKNL